LPSNRTLTLLSDFKDTPVQLALSDVKCLCSLDFVILSLPNFYSFIYLLPLRLTLTTACNVYSLGSHAGFDYIFNFIRRDQNDSSKTIIRKKNNINQNKQSAMYTDTKIVHDRDCLICEISPAAARK